MGEESGRGRAQVASKLKEKLENGELSVNQRKRYRKKLSKLFHAVDLGLEDSGTLGASSACTRPSTKVQEAQQPNRPAFCLGQWLDDGNNCMGSQKIGSCSTSQPAYLKPASSVASEELVSSGGSFGVIVNQTCSQDLKCWQRGNPPPGLLVHASAPPPPHTSSMQFRRGGARVVECASRGWLGHANFSSLMPLISAEISTSDALAMQQQEMAGSSPCSSKAGRSF